MGYFLASPLRKLLENPNRILGPHLKEGMKVLDLGCAMGFFSLPMARMVGENGKVVCVDLQAKMLKSLEKRARKAGLFGRIETRACKQDTLGLADLKDEVDFVLAYAVVHEVPDAADFFSEVYESVRQGGRVLVAEPKGHVSDVDFEKTVAVAERSGFSQVGSPPIRRSHGVLLAKK
jgi:cyclopropane fatty-acyl-phospholipid synthase-like methyltransferase